MGKSNSGGIQMNRKKRKENEEISTDPFGSYTGIPDIPDEKPVQDADDL